MFHPKLYNGILITHIWLNFIKKNLLLAATVSLQVTETLVDRGIKKQQYLPNLSFCFLFAVIHHEIEIVIEAESCVTVVVQLIQVVHA